MKSNRLVIGLDYGTTYTGVSFCETSDTRTGNEQIEIIVDYPSQQTKIGTKEKVPSEVSYQEGGLVWGSLIRPDVPRHVWTKLRLDPDQASQLAQVIREVSTSAQDSKKEPVEIVADFLMQLKAHLIVNLDRRYGNILWKSLDITLVVTVPAVWSDVAKARTIEAVTKAGFNKLEFPQLKNTIMTTEPEAAAIYTINSLQGTAQDLNFKVGDGFILCDLGGGTVDLITYRVASRNPTRVKEATIGSGDQCGGTFVDRAFLEWLELRVGSHDFVNMFGCRSEQIACNTLSKKAARMLRDFILDAKSGFSGTETNHIRLPSPLNSIEEDSIRGISDGEITIRPEDMVKMFDKSLRRTYELLGEQLQQARQQKKLKMKYVFLVGGFSESPYMYKKIKTFVEKSGGLQTIKPAYAWSAVARGAVLKGLHGNYRTILQRKCRRHYGTSCGPVWNPREHMESDAYIDSYDGIKRANGQMKWLFRKGQELPTTGTAHAISHFKKDFWADEKKSTSITLYRSEINDAPQRKSHQDVYEVSTVAVDLSRVPEKEFTIKRSPSGKLYHELNYEVHISIQSSLEFSLVVNGKTYGSLIATYD